MSPPFVFPLISCDNSQSRENPVTMGCLAKDFLPSPVTFSWSFQNKTDFSSQNFQDVLRDGKYSASSQVSLSSADMQGTDEFVLCNVKHTTGDKQVQVPFVAQVPDPLPPHVTVFIPPRDAFSGTSLRTSKLICQATGFTPKRISVTWFREGKELISGFVTGKVEVEPKESRPVTYRISSMLTIAENDWFSQNVFTCQVEHNGLIFRKNVSSACSGGSNIKVFPIPPSFASIFLTKVAKLTCLVTDLTTYDSLNISWTRKNGKYLETRNSPPESYANSTISIRGEATVCVEEWESGEEFTCTVIHRDLPSPLKYTIAKPKDMKKQIPSVYVLPPTREQLSLRESASITCLVKNFSPPDVFVQWMQRGQPMSTDTYVTSTPQPEPQDPNLYFVHSVLTVNEEDWSAGDTYTCVVAHEALPYSVTERTVDKSTEGEVSAEEEGFENLNTMASTFIVLFLLSLFYSTTVTLFKVK